MTRRPKRHAPEQIIRKLREADALLAAGKDMGQVCQALEVSEATWHRWRNAPPSASSRWTATPTACAPSESARADLDAARGQAICF